MKEGLLQRQFIEPEGIGDFYLELELYTYNMDFKCYECIGGPTDPGNEWVYNDTDQNCVYKVSEAAVYLYGHIKWDGCANIVFEEQTNSADRKDVFMLHYCGLDHFERTWKLMQKLYKLAKELIPRWSE